MKVFADPSELVVFKNGLKNVIDVWSWCKTNVTEGKKEEEEEEKDQARVFLLDDQ